MNNVECLGGAADVAGGADVAFRGQNGPKN